VSDRFYVSTDKDLLDQEFVIGEIESSYWGADQSKATILKAIDNSLCFGLYRAKDEAEHGRDVQIGFARVVTDHATFAWLADVIVMDCYRKAGLGTMLMKEILSHPLVKPRKIVLFTATAHGFYQKFGFKRFEAMKYEPPGY
jgi:GNAT superfamily N-acetyltransferase